jgi:NADH-quinone oxidoreductase subunit M
LAGSLVLLLAILAVYLQSAPRTFDMAHLIATRPLDGAGTMAAVAFSGFVIAFAIKAPLVPFHTWLPPAHVDAPAPASTILAGVLLKMGTYGFVRVLLQMMPATFARFAAPIAILAVVSVVYGALVALAQQNLKRRIAYTSINHMGYVVLGLSAAAAAGHGAPAARVLAITGATVEMVAHGLITGALFLITGSIWLRAETYDMNAFGGLARRAPILTVLATTAAFASLGLPGLAGFVAEFQIFVGSFSAFPWLTAVAVSGILITAALFLNLLQRVFLGELPERRNDWMELGRVEIASIGVLVALVVVIGVAPGWLLSVIDSAATPMVGR